MVLPPDLQNSGLIAVEGKISLLDYGLIVHSKEPTALIATRNRHAVKWFERGQGQVAEFASSAA
ncbi:hypothetical protein BFX40_12655 [Mesorhizobium sp. SEMIA 3007]|nr:hypothetical protein BFX40_12655 [Mesorhizobium sp. SEMIA 3007]